jgi:hypothetical protein
MKACAFVVPRDRIERSSSRLQRDAWTTQAVWAHCERATCRARVIVIDYSFFIVPSSPCRRVRYELCSGNFDHLRCSQRAVRGEGFEPSSCVPETQVLPLYEPRSSAAGENRTLNLPGKNRMLCLVELRRRVCACRRTFLLHRRILSWEREESNLQGLITRLVYSQLASPSCRTPKTKKGHRSFLGWPSIRFGYH